MNATLIRKKFAEAGLACRVMSEPIRKTDPDIFQLDIFRQLKGAKRIEVFRIWPGADDNEVHILSVDKQIQQLVLLVKEPLKHIDQHTIIDKRSGVALSSLQVGEEVDKAKKTLARQHKIKLEDLAVTTQKRRVGGRKMHYLLGVDERQLFIAQTRQGVSSVKQAHESLKGNAVTLAEGRVPGKTMRQGEWFFLNLTVAQQAGLTRLLKGSPHIKKKNVPINNSGNPHVASELVRLTLDDQTKLGYTLPHGFPVQSDTVFVRGRVTHRDHAPLKLKQWRRVIRNNEGATARGAARGVYWID